MTNPKTTEFIMINIINNNKPISRLITNKNNMWTTPTRRKTALCKIHRAKNIKHRSIEFSHTKNKSTQQPKQIRIYNNKEQEKDPNNTNSANPPNMQKRIINQNTYQDSIAMKHEGQHTQTCMPNPRKHKITKCTANNNKHTRIDDQHPDIFTMPPYFPKDVNTETNIKTKVNNIIIATHPSRHIQITYNACMRRWMMNCRQVMNNNILQETLAIQHEAHHTQTNKMHRKQDQTHETILQQTLTNELKSTTNKTEHSREPSKTRTNKTEHSREP